jgi:hypothetical protein
MRFNNVLIHKKTKIKFSFCIFSADIRKLYHQTLPMNPDTPQGLLNKVLFETIFYFCRRGRENIKRIGGFRF